MTCYVICELCELLKIDIDSYEITVSPKASRMIGTTANLIHPNCRLSIKDALYGMMLNSGNDAATA